MSGNSNTLVINVPYQLDVAIITQNFQEISLQTGSEHVFDLDLKNITESMFKSIFYKSNAFSITPKANLIPEALDLIRFTNQTYSSHPFSLLDTITHNIINDLSITQNMISTNSLINLNKDLNSLLTLCDLSVSNVTNSLNWSDIVNTLIAEFGVDKDVSPPVILTVSVIFVTPTPNVNNTIIRFNFKTTVTLN